MSTLSAIRRAAVVPFCLFLFAAVPALADNAPGATSTEILRKSTWGDGVPLAYPAGTPEITAAIVEVKPGADTGVHQHDNPLFAYILEGELTVTIADGSSKIYKAGDALMETSVAHHGHNEGTTPVKLLAVYIGAQGVPLSRKP